MQSSFESMFKTLTGNEPFAWQGRLHGQWLAGDIKPVIDLPTGLGKTSVIAIWLITRTLQKRAGAASPLPTRLVYVVDRRTVVDQATAECNKLIASVNAAGLTADETPCISTLRGQLADNREWSRDPSKPAIIIGTVDMIGSRLLFSGYRSSYKRRPLEAGLLGQDTLLILDEAHLSRPFESLLKQVANDGAFQQNQGKPLRVVRMSATIGDGNTSDLTTFKLTADDLAGTPENNEIVKRYQAAKRLTIHPAADDKPHAEMGKKAAELAADGSRVVLFVRLPKDAEKIAGDLRSHFKKLKLADPVKTLTGTMRGFERDKLLAKPAMQRFLVPDNTPAEGPVILVSTSAGEVGFDLNADHLVCDAAPLDSMIQRLGRVNRRGSGTAQVHLFAIKYKEDKKKKQEAQSQTTEGDAAAESSPPAKHTFESAAIAATALLSKLPQHGDGTHDAGPQALVALEKPAEAQAPTPAIVPITDILLDHWSMTTIVEPMPGRPPVSDYIRGITQDLPETTIAWRTELGLPGFGELELADIEEWFDAHPIFQHETLSVPAYDAAKWMLERWQFLSSEQQAKLADLPVIIDRGGLQAVKLSSLITQLDASRTNLLINSDIILPAAFGGIGPDGMLQSKDTGDMPNGDSVPVDVADYAPRSKTDTTTTSYRWRGIYKDDAETPLVPGVTEGNKNQCSKFTLRLGCDDEGSQPRLISYVPKEERPEAGIGRQTLREHVAAVCKHADRISNALCLPKTEAAALQLAAQWHDNGKDRPIWQQSVGRRADEEPLAKSGGTMRKIPGNYRHEFGSLCELASQEPAYEPEVFDLAMHLIATHHGRSRPHFPQGARDPNAPAQSPAIAHEAMRRFARLQRKYGWWRLAWLENLLRCADAIASAEKPQEVAVPAASPAPKEAAV